MTQSPLGSDPSQAGPFDGPGPGEPDLPTTQQDLTTSQGASVPSDPAYSATAGSYQSDDSYRAGDTYRTTESATYGSTTDTGTSDTGSKVDTAKGEAKQVAGTAVDSTKQVAQTAKAEATNVVAETKQQAASLLDTIRSEGGQQLSNSQNLVADTLHGLAKELGGMASASEESGPLTDLVHQASQKSGEVAHWLQDREPADVLESVRSYGRRHPVTFLALCGLAGVVAGRLTRSAVATRTSLDDKHHDTGNDVSRPTGYVTAPATPVVPAPATPPVSTGVYGGSLESTAPADPYADDQLLTGTGQVGGVGSYNDPNGDLKR